MSMHYGACIYREKSAIYNQKIDIKHSVPIIYQRKKCFRQKGTKVRNEEKTNWGKRGKKTYSTKMYEYLFCVVIRQNLGEFMEGNKNIFHAKNHWFQKKFADKRCFPTLLKHYISLVGEAQISIFMINYYDYIS